MNNGRNATELLICPMFSTPDGVVDSRCAHPASSTTGAAISPLRTLRRPMRSDIDRLPAIDPLADQPDQDVEDPGDDAQHHQRREHPGGVELRGRVVDQVTET